FTSTFFDIPYCPEKTRSLSQQVGIDARRTGGTNRFELVGSQQQPTDFDLSRTVYVYLAATQTQGQSSADISSSRSGSVMWDSDQLQDTLQHSLWRERSLGWIHS